MQAELEVDLGWKLDPVIRGEALEAETLLIPANDAAVIELGRR